MEEILASIRRIIADGKPGRSEPDAPEPDVAPPPPEPKSLAPNPSPGPDRSGAGAERPVTAPDASDPALMLTRMVAEGGSVLTVAPGELGQGEVIAVEEALLLTEPLPAEASRPAAASTMAPTAAAPASPQAPRWIEPPSRASAPPAVQPPAATPQAAASQAAASQPASPQPVPQAPPPAPETAPSPPAIRAGRTIEEVALEALEPMLRAWLDRHLQEIVERRVQEEIDRISRKSES
jgi:cell pole-organizing protein PopZ